MKTLDLIQGSAEWHAHRAQHFNASDAPAMMGASKYVTRNDLIKRLATGITPEIDSVTQARFDRGHEVEPLARALAEEFIGEELFPVVGVADDGKLSASFDGLTMDESVVWECKQWNEQKAAEIRAGRLPEDDRWQVQQQLCVAEKARKLLYTVSDGTPERTVHLWVKPSAEDQRALVAGWKQLDEDVKSYQPVAAPAPVAVVQVETLPAVSVRVDGAIAVTSNLDVFGGALKEFIARINLKPETDEDFAAAESAIKTLERAQEHLENAKAGGLAQTANIEEMCRTVDQYADTARRTRLMLEKLVRARKDEIRAEMVATGKRKWEEHVRNIDIRLGRVRLNVPAPDFAGAIKNKRTLSSLRSSVDDELARAKIAASEVADRIAANLRVLDEKAAGKTFLFSDIQAIAYKAEDDFAGLVKARIDAHEAAEAARLEQERARIREEEERKATEKAKREADELAQAEAKRLADERAAAARPAPAAESLPAEAPLPDSSVPAAPRIVERWTRQAPRPVATVTLGFEGYSDDTFGEVLVTKDDYDNCASGKPIEYHVVDRERGVGLCVIGQHCPLMSSGWGITVAPLEVANKGHDPVIPDWPLRLVKVRQAGRDAFRLEIDVPATAGVVCVTREQQAARA